jgi:hypothetical protein
MSLEKRLFFWGGGVRVAESGVITESGLSPCCSSLRKEKEKVVLELMIDQVFA